MHKKRLQTLLLISPLMMASAENVNAMEQKNAEKEACLDQCEHTKLIESGHCFKGWHFNKNQEAFANCEKDVKATWAHCIDKCYQH